MRPSKLKRLIDRAVKRSQQAFDEYTVDKKDYHIAERIISKEISMLSDHSIDDSFTYELWKGSMHRMRGMIENIKDFSVRAFEICYNRHPKKSHIRCNRKPDHKGRHEYRREGRLTYHWTS